MPNDRLKLLRCQQKYRICEDRFHNIINNSLDGILIVDHNGTILFANPAAGVMFGKSTEDLSAQPFGFPVVGADRAELDIPLPIGETIIVEMRVSETEWDGHNAFLTQLRDITQRKQLEESLRLASKVFESSTEAIIILDMHMRLLSSNHAFTQMTGFASEEAQGIWAASLWINQQGTTIRFDEVLREALQRHGRWQGEVECYRKDGTRFPGWLSVVVVRDGMGVLTHYVAIFSDISERKANENALRLAAVVFEQSVEAVIVLDSEERFVSVNRSFTEVTGYNSDEVLGRTPRILKSGRQDKAFYRTMWHHILEHGYWQGEIWNRRKSGEIYPEWLSVSVVRNEQGGIVNYIGIFSDIIERKQQDERINQLAFFDPLTQLPNRQLLMDRLRLAMANADRQELGIGVIFIDLNRFKEINDIHGHDVGDEVLIESGRRFQSCLRQNETLARLGGDEFVAIIDSRDHSTLTVIAERLQNALFATPIIVNDYSFTIRLSAGIAIYPYDGETSDDLLKLADVAMYRAKAQGGGHCFYRSEMSEDMIERILIADRLKNAISNNKLQLYYQPQVDLASGELIGAEALLRWHDEVLGWISPSRFIPIAEERGMMQELG